MLVRWMGICLLMLLTGIPADAAEYELNLVRNPNFKPGLDGQGPMDWLYYTNTTNIYDAGRGFASFSEDGMTIDGPADLVQLEMFDDITPGYRLSARVKAENGQSLITMRFRDARNHTVMTRATGVWENIELDVESTGHYGFNVKITVPPGARLTINELRITPVLRSAEISDGEIWIVADAGQTPARGIRLPSEPNWVEQLAAHELRLNMFLVSGTVLPVFEGSGVAEEKGFIRFANLKKTISDRMLSDTPENWRDKLFGIFKGRAPAAQAPDANGFRIICESGNVDVIGGNDAGVLAGAMHLSELMGAKYYAPRVYAIERNPLLVVPEMDISRQPAFEWADGVGNQHSTWTPWKYGFLHPDSCVAPSQKASPPGVGGWVHPPAFLAPPFMYAESHPEFYALVNGQRVIEDFAGGLAYLNLCLGNPELQRVVADRIARLMEMYPQAKYFSVAQGDGMKWCECDLCTALDVDENILTDRLVAFANAVAEILDMPTKYPDRQLLVMAYAAQREDIPLREKLHPNVAVQYAFWKSSWPIWGATFCEQNQRGLALLDEWNTYTGTNLTLFLYPVNTYENAEKIKLAAEKHIRGFYHCGWRGDFPETTIYTTGRLIWNPDADVEAMIDEIMPHIYGDAAPFMREYFNMHHAFLRQAIAEPVLWNQYFDKLAMPRMLRLPADYAAPAWELLRRAASAVGNNADVLSKIQEEQWRVLLAWLNLESAEVDAMNEKQFTEHAERMAELVSLGRTLGKSAAFRNISFPDWLYQASAGALDIDRDPRRWHQDPQIDLFLATPGDILKQKLYLQQAVANGLELPARAWKGTRYYKNYHGHPAVVLRRKSSPESRARAYFRLDEMANRAGELHLQGLDNEKEETAEIRIMINGREIFAGPVAYPKNKWDWQVYEIPEELLKQGENLIVIENIMEDYKQEIRGQAGPADEALAQDYNWGWCMVGQARLVWDAHSDVRENTEQE